MAVLQNRSSCILLFKIVLINYEHKLFNNIIFTYIHIIQDKIVAEIKRSLLSSIIIYRFLLPCMSVFLFSKCTLDWENIVYIAVSLRRRVQKNNVSLDRLVQGWTSVSPHLSYNFRTYIRNVIIGMYTSHMGLNRCALVHTSIGAESSRERWIPRIWVPLLDEYTHLLKSGEWLLKVS